MNAQDIINEIEKEDLKEEWTKEEFNTFLYQKKKDTQDMKSFSFSIEPGSPLFASYLENQDLCFKFNYIRGSKK